MAMAEAFTRREWVWRTVTGLARIAIVASLLLTAVYSVSADAPPVVHAEEDWCSPC
ncbi:MAG TPA: hypothetical protein VFX49_02795 [Chloroflexota bacterium]|nr:hypothetical protein [Chloroflexota bacterium]